jgi:lysophospholipase L1-like esterase
VDKISEMTGATINNQGFSGAKFAMIVNHEPWNDHSFYTYSNTLDLTNIDYLWVAYGTNDFGNNVPMGDTTTDEYTFKGAIYKSLQNLMTRKPTLKILFSVPIFRATFDGTNYADLDTYANTQGLKMLDYVNAIKDICHQFRVPVFDSWYECGINQFNYQTYLLDMLHPNEEGHKLIGTRFGHFVNQYL